MTKTITNDEYSSVLQNAAKPVVLEFGADW
jgi:hypothetical protein